MTSYKEAKPLLEDWISCVKVTSLLGSHTQAFGLVRPRNVMSVSLLGDDYLSAYCASLVCPLLYTCITIYFLHMFVPVHLHTKETK